MAYMDMKDLIGTMNDVRAVLAQAGEGSLIRELNDALTELESQAWQRGWDMGCSLGTRELERRAEQLVQVAAAMRGKDRADGVIRFEVYPDPKVYDWTAE